MGKKAVISGIGYVLPVENPWEYILKGESWLDSVTRVDYESVEEEAKNVRCRKNIIRQMNSVHHLLLVAISRALDDAGLKIAKLKSSRVCLLIGSDYGDLEVYEKFFNTKNPNFFSASLPSTPTLAMSIALQINGPSVIMMSEYASGLEAIAYALGYLETGYVDTIIAGGFDKISPTIEARFKGLGLLSQSGISRPYSKNSDGLVLSEGAGIVIIEAEEKVKERDGGKIYARLAGHSISVGADEEIIMHTYKRALQASSIESPDLIVGTANGTTQVDRREARSIEKCARDVPVTNFKSVTGETLGLGGVFNMIGGCYCLRDNVIPPTLHVNHDECAYDINLVTGLEHKEINHVMVNSFGTNNNMFCLEKVHNM